MKISIDLNKLECDDLNVAEIIKQEIEDRIRAEVRKAIKSDTAIISAVKSYKAKAVVKICKELGL